MKYFILQAVVAHWQQHDYIAFIKRIGDNLLKLSFGRDQIYYIDLTKGNSLIFQKEESPALKSYSAPFDAMLQKYFSKSHVQSITLHPQDKIIRIDASSSSSYKSQRAILQLEFTGKNTNAILLTPDDVILEALRHIGEETSFRVVKPNKKLLPLPPHELKEKTEEIPDITLFLHQLHEQKIHQKLEGYKKQALASLAKKESKLQNMLDSLENIDDLQRKADGLSLQADLILANLHLLPPYRKKVEVSDFEGQPATITLPSQARDYKEASKIYYDQSRRSRQKAQNLHIEEQNLKDKITFTQRLTSIIQEASSIDEIDLYLPKKRNKIKKEKQKNDQFETFFIEGYKISLGKSSRENNLLLKYAKADDTWLHLRDIPSCHVIIHSGKQNIPQQVLENAARICVQFSTTAKGAFEVDYTKRKHVRIQEGSNVLYTHYKTLSVAKE